MSHADKVGSWHQVYNSDLSVYKYIYIVAYGHDGIYSTPIYMPISIWNRGDYTSSHPMRLNTNGSLTYIAGGTNSIWVFTDTHGVNIHIFGLI